MESFSQVNQYLRSHYAALMSKYATFNGQLDSLWNSNSSLSASIASILDLPAVSLDYCSM